MHDNALHTSHPFACPRHLFEQMSRSSQNPYPHKSVCPCVSVPLYSLYIFPLLWSHRVSSLPFASLRCASLLFFSFPPPVFLHVYPALSVYVMVDQKSFIRKRPFFANNNVTLSLSLYLSISLSISLSLYISISLSLCLSISPSIHPFIHPSNLSTVTYFSYLPISLSTYLSTHLSTYLQVPIYPSIHIIHL